MPIRTLLCLLLLALSLQAHPAPTPLRCVGASFPYILEEENGKLRGVAVDLLAQLEQELGFSCKIELLPWKRAQALVMHGDADLLIGPYRTSERDAKLAFLSLPFYLDSMLLYGRQDSSVNWQGDFNKLAGLRLGVTAGWTLGERYEASKALLQLDEAQSLDKGFLKLMAGRVDLVASNQRNALVVIRELKLSEQVKELSPPMQQTAGYFAMAPQWRQRPLFAQLDAAHSRLVRQGRVQAISRAYGLSFPGSGYDWQSFREREL